MATPPVRRASATLRGNSTSGTLTLPGTLVADDYGLLTVCNNDGMGNPTAAPSGWSVIVPTVAINAKQRVTIYGKTYAAGDPNPSQSWGVSSNWAMEGVWYSNCAGVGALGSFTGSASGTTSTAAADTTTSDQNMVVTIATHFAGSLGFATSATPSPDATLNAAFYGTATFHHGIWIGDVVKATAGATNAQTITWDVAGTGMGGIQIALIPALPLQVWVPTTDTGATITGWTKTPSGAAGIFTVLADSDPTSYAETADNPAAQVYQTPTFSLQVPADLTSVKVRVSAYFSAGTSGSVLAQLYQGTTLIKQQTITLTASNVETVMSLTSTEAGTMTVTSGSWNNLSVKLSATAA